MAVLTESAQDIALYNIMDEVSFIDCSAAWMYVFIGIRACHILASISTGMACFLCFMLAASGWELLQHFRCSAETANSDTQVSILQLYAETHSGGAVYLSSKNTYATHFRGNFRNSSIDSVVCNGG